ncbi:hypothetical protein PRIPAC_94003 [Pristionchus pacificus]|uniref:Uncharacterized protein n=1 Tax=Pristionchus pacificus TaxID=54126 RepID=A0A2A6CH77_PRIPA|nr:hypothetical protein PRIPAC_94003 [Pristionchus pacificus]|eukprot:PDM77489.1 hypothetical protein PRIPAC_34356 [Pristionchus pacificus]
MSSCLRNVVKRLRSMRKSVQSFLHPILIFLHLASPPPAPPAPRTTEYTLSTLPDSPPAYHSVFIRNPPPRVFLQPRASHLPPSFGETRVYPI